MGIKNSYLLLNKELNLIQDNKIRDFTRQSLKRAYNDFWKDPASQGHHHRFKGGLIVHTKKAVWFAKEKARMYGYDAHITDLLISALLLHDITQWVRENKNYRAKYKTHPYSVRILLWDLAKMISKEDFNKIMEGIETHMGIWWHHTEVPRTQFQRDVYECDYLASREGIILKEIEENKNE